jgi:hypothetical protein
MVRKTKVLNVKTDSIKTVKMERVILICKGRSYLTSVYINYIKLIKKILSSQHVSYVGGLRRFM